MKKSKVKHFILGVVFTLLFTYMIVPASAELFRKNIEVSTGVNIYMDDTKLNPTDANGNPVDVFIYNGTTYLPVRAVSQAMDKAVSWDGTTKSVYLGKHDSNEPAANIMDLESFYDSDRNLLWDDIESRYPSGVIDNIGNKYYKGFYFDSGTIWSKNGSKVYNIDDKYTKLTGTVALGEESKSADNATVIKIYGDDKLLYKSPDLKKGMYPEDFTIDLTGVLQLKIEKTGDGYRNACILSGLDLYN